MLVTCVAPPHALVGLGCPTIQAASGAAKLTLGCVASAAAARRVCQAGGSSATRSNCTT